MVDHDLRPADVVILPYGTSRERVRYAVYLYRQGYARKIVLSNEEIDIAGIDTSDSGELVRREIILLGLPAEDVILLYERATSTYEEAGYLRQVMLKEGFRSAIVVAEPYRSRRTFLTYKKAFGEDIALLSSVPEEENPRASKWWQRRQGISILYNEYPRLLLYFLKGRL